MNAAAPLQYKLILGRLRSRGVCQCWCLSRLWPGCPLWSGGQSSHPFPIEQSWLSDAGACFLPASLRTSFRCASQHGGAFGIILNQRAPAWPPQWFATQAHLGTAITRSRQTAAHLVGQLGHKEAQITAGMASVLGLQVSLCLHRTVCMPASHSVHMPASHSAYMPASHSVHAAAAP